MIRIRHLALAALLAAPATGAAQQWKPIGTTTRDANELFVRESSIKRGGDTVSALVLTRFAAAAFDPVSKDSLRALTTQVTFDCKLEKVKVIETVYFVNFDRNRVSKRSKPKIPGWGSVFGAAYPIVFKHLCGRAPK